MNEKFKERLTEAMKKQGVRAIDLAYATGISKARISQYMSGQYIPKQNGLHSIAKALNVSEAWLMGYDIEMERDLDTIPDNIYPINLKKFRVLGEIACGLPTYAEEEYETYIEASSDINADFCLIARGDSMTGVRINDGDVVFIKEQSVVENGQIAAVIINNEATLKTWYFYPDEKKLILNPENPNYPPLVFIGEQLVEVRCLGRAICFTSYL